MGRNKCFRWCPCFSCFKAKYRVSQDYQMNPLPKPKEAEEVADGVPYIDEKEEKDILIIRKIDPCVMTNGINHHTSKYELMSRSPDPQLVVRRGKPFRLDISLNRAYNEEKDGISFIFTVEDEEKPSYGQGTLVGVPMLKKADKNLSWNVVLESITENVLTVQVTPAADCVVAKWHLDVDTKIIDDGAYSYSWDTSIYILYNPWCKLDQVYLKYDEWREETVLNDVGLIYRGTANRIRPCAWKFDQFEKNVLDCALYLVHITGKVKGNARSDPVETARAVAAATNGVDDMGAVMGNWSTDFSGGTAPTEWMGSKKIMQEYYKKKKPVRYGQCWVFSGVLTTVCRALGIPCRPVTNYSSAHDTQGSLTVDYFMDKEGTVMEELNSDSVWNFHVWNEVWMQRPDLGFAYGGWQAIDATPQEKSDGVFRVGPASVVAIKQGEVKRPYDNPFLYAEVNADKVYWRYTGPTQPLKLLSKDIYGIGKLLITKAPHKFEIEEITNSYKYPEKTGEERATMLKALQQSENLFSRYYLNEEFSDIRFNFELHDDIKIGQTFNVSLVMRNRSKDKDHKVHVILKVDVVTYTGKVGEAIKKDTYDVTVKADTVTEVKLPVSYEEYSKRLIDQGSFSISCLATVEATQFEYYAQDDFRVRKPDIKISIQGKAIKGVETTAEISLENSLPVPLKKGQFIVEGPGLEKPLKMKVNSPVPPGEKAIAELKFIPPRAGRESLTAKFVSKEMDDVDGFLIFMVEANKEENGNATT